MDLSSPAPRWEPRGRCGDRELGRWEAGAPCDARGRDRELLAAPLSLGSRESLGPLQAGSSPGDPPPVRGLVYPPLVLMGRVLARAEEECGPAGSDSLLRLLRSVGL